MFTMAAPHYQYLNCYPFSQSPTDILIGKTKVVVQDGLKYCNLKSKKSNCFQKIHFAPLPQTDNKDKTIPFALSCRNSNPFPSNNHNNYDYIKPWHQN